MLTLVVALTAFKQSKLPRVVHNSELLQQGFNDLACPCAGADVQVFGRVLGEIEGSTAFNPTGSLAPSILCRRALPGWRNGHRSNQLELDLYEAVVGPILVLLRRNNL